MRHCTTFQSAASWCFIIQFHVEGSIKSQRWSQRETVYKTFPHSLQKAVLSKPRQPYLSWELQANEHSADRLTCLLGDLPWLLETRGKVKKVKSFISQSLSYSSFTCWWDEMGNIFYSLFWNSGSDFTRLLRSFIRSLNNGSTVLRFVNIPMSASRCLRSQYKLMTKWSNYSYQHSFYYYLTVHVEFYIYSLSIYIANYILNKCFL